MEHHKFSSALILRQSHYYLAGLIRQKKKCMLDLTTRIVWKMRLSKLVLQSLKLLADLVQRSRRNYGQGGHRRVGFREGNGVGIVPV